MNTKILIKSKKNNLNFLYYYSILKENFRIIILASLSTQDPKENVDDDADERQHNTTQNMTGN